MSAPPLLPAMQIAIDKLDKIDCSYQGLLVVDLLKAIKEYQMYIEKMERDHAETISEMFHNKLNQES